MVWVVVFSRLKKDFIEKFRSLIHKHREYQVFSDFVEVGAIVAHQAFYNLKMFPQDDAYKQLEKRYMEFVPIYGREGLTTFSEMFAIVQAALNTTKGDFLGEVYQELELNTKYKGQFFTPYHLSKMIALMLLDKEGIERAISQKGFVSIEEPACGAGGMLIAACEVVEELGYDPRQVVYFEATDVDKTCFNMSYLQLASLGIPGFVIHGNSLNQEVWEQRPTPQLQLYLKREELNHGSKTVLKMLSLLSLASGEEAQKQKAEVEDVSTTETNATNEETASVPPRQLDIFLDWQSQVNQE